MPGPGLAGLFRYGESELDAAVQAEILLESARNEARFAIWEIVVCLFFGMWSGFNDPVFRALIYFVLVTSFPFLVDAWLRRSAAKRLMGHTPRPAKKAA